MEAPLRFISLTSLPIFIISEPINALANTENFICFIFPFTLNESNPLLLYSLYRNQTETKHLALKQLFAHYKGCQYFLHVYDVFVRMEQKYYFQSVRQQFYKLL